MNHPALQPGRTAVITGAASGIGLATALRLAGLGMNVALCDLPGPALDAAVEAAARAAHPGGQPGAWIRALAADVRELDQLCEVQRIVTEAAGATSFLMNNAAIGANPGRAWENHQGWMSLLTCNLGGVINGVQAFACGMLESGMPGLIVNTGSKQGITLPPGNGAYNVSKAGVKAYTETLSHELREAGGKVAAHLLIPGFTYTGMTGATSQPADAWSADQVVEFMFDSLERGDFYILCPDNAVTRDMDERRMRWAVGDILENRPALSRWHPDYKEAFARFMREP